MKNLIYSGMRQATNSERKTNNAEVVFSYEDQSTGETVKVYAAKCYESWEQWGAPTELLSRNVDRVEKWRNSLMR
jgi:hypothetical protein